MWIALWLLGLLALAALVAWWENNGLSATPWTIACARLPEECDGLRAVHISDLHNKRFGREGARLLRLVRAQKPDVVWVTGDVLDRNHTDIAFAERFMRALTAIAPVYFCPGNHEAVVPGREEFYAALSAMGVAVLRNRETWFPHRGGRLRIVGVDDPFSYFPDDPNHNLNAGTLALNAALCRLAQADTFTVLLTHRAELMDLYALAGYDLAFSGHAHGGQMRLPKLGGLFAPHQIIPPVYTAGPYEQAGTKMLVSRGLGNSTFPLRFHNRPEILTCVLRKA